MAREFQSLGDNTCVPWRNIWCPCLIVYCLCHALVLCSRWLPAPRVLLPTHLAKSGTVLHWQAPDPFSGQERGVTDNTERLRWRAKAAPGVRGSETMQGSWQELGDMLFKTRKPVRPSSHPVSQILTREGHLIDSPRWWLLIILMIFILK